jgi:DNA-binding LytR/AlgR family response regulator
VLASKSSTLFPITSMNNNFQTSSNHYVLVNQKQKTLIPVENIIMLESQSNYSVFHLKYGKKRIYAHTIRHFENQLLDQQFIRVHSSFLINPVFVVEYDREDGKLKMENNLEANISRRKRKNLKGFSFKNMAN